jgi:hypothetical protein
LPYHTAGYLLGKLGAFLIEFKYQYYSSKIISGGIGVCFKITGIESLLFSIDFTGSWNPFFFAVTICVFILPEFEQCRAPNAVFFYIAY